MEDWAELLQQHHVVGLIRIPPQSVAQAHQHLSNISHLHTLMSSPRIPQDDPDRGSGLYCQFNFLDRLLTKDGFVNVWQLYKDCLEGYSPILEKADFLAICQQEIAYLQSIGAVIEILA